MIREICKDEAFLAQKAEPATADDLGVAQDLLDTLIAHKDGCVGMAANMIGVNKRIIAFENENPGSHADRILILQSLCQRKRIGIRPGENLHPHFPVRTIPFFRLSR